MKRIVLKDKKTLSGQTPKSADDIFHALSLLQESFGFRKSVYVAAAGCSDGECGQMRLWPPERIGNAAADHPVFCRLYRLLFIIIYPCGKGQYFQTEIFLKDGE